MTIDTDGTKRGDIIKSARDENATKGSLSLIKTSMGATRATQDRIPTGNDMD
jgi:hypothetical protein